LMPLKTVAYKQPLKTVAHKQSIAFNTLN